MENKKLNFYETVQELAKLNDVHCILPVDLEETGSKRSVLVFCYSSNAQKVFLQSLLDCEICQLFEVTEFLGYKLLVNYEPKED